MKSKILLILLSILIVASLSACVRPAPNSTPPATATQPAPGIVPTLQLPSGVTPTPQFVATIDPNAPIGATAEPGAPVDPAAASPTPEPPAPEPTAEPQPEAPTGETIHVVQPGDNLYRIGLRYGFTAEELAAYNGIANPDRIDVGQQIRIPPTP